MFRHIPRPDPVLVLALLFALGFRLGWALYMDARPFDDAQSYFNLASDIANGRTYDEFGKAYWPVGYPATLALFFLAFGESVGSAEALNIIVSLLIVTLTYNLAHQLQGRHVARLAALLVAFLPGQIFTVTLVLSESVFSAVQLAALCLLVAALKREPPKLEEEESTTPLATSTSLAGLAPAAAIPLTTALGSALLVVVLLLASWRWRSAQLALFTLAGVFAGYALLVKPVAIVLVPALLLALLLIRGRVPMRACAMLLYAAVFVVVTLATVAPWSARNIEELGTPALTTNAGVNTLIGYHDGAGGCWSFDYENHRYVTEIEDEMERQREAFDLAFDFIRDEPLETAALIPLRFECIWDNDEDALGHWNRFQQDKQLSEPGYSVVRFVNNWYYYALLALAVLGLPLWWRWRTVQVLLPLVVIFTVLYYMAFYGDDRYHQPLMPLIAIWAACGVSLIPRWSRMRPISWPRS
ncbi:MAG: glycosyltransferase family 39 protein [Dehalococcoidia bacterium]